MDRPAFQDEFGNVAPDYAAFRPGYPPALFDYVAGFAPARRRAWDCGTGSGQAATGLAPRFDRVIATDASPAQLREAQPDPRVAYAVARAEAAPLASRSIDLVVVAQALHWFDARAFFAEARRVLVERGALAVWCYGRARVGPGIDGPIERLYDDTLGPYWPSARSLVENGYRDVEFPFDEVPARNWALDQPMTLAEFAGYVATWSATRRYRESTGVDPVPALVAEIAEVWGVDRVRVVRWPLAVRVGVRPYEGG